MGLFGHRSMKRTMLFGNAKLGKFRFNFDTLAPQTSFFACQLNQIKFLDGTFSEAVAPYVQPPVQDPPV